MGDILICNGDMTIIENEFGGVEGFEYGSLGSGEASTLDVLVEQDYEELLEEFGFGG